MGFASTTTECAGGVLPQYFPGLNNANVERHELIQRYFSIGLGYDDILLFFGFSVTCFFSEEEELTSRLLRHDETLIQQFSVVAKSRESENRG